jgi:Ca-activated chloride channel family protein
MNTINQYLRSAGNWLDGAFLAPLFFSFLALIPIVILLYLLKLRRTPVTVPSTILWHKSLQDLTANAPFQRLRKNLLLLLQIVVLLLLVFGMARPYVKAEGTQGANVILLIDRSASMQTVEADEKTRIEIAREKALEMVDEMVGGDKMMVVAFADKSDVLCELTTDRYRLRRAIRSIEATDTATRLRDAVLVASSLQPTVPDLRMVVLSDGNIADLAEVGSRAFDVSYLQIGETRNNAGIVAFSMRDPQEGRGERQSLVLVHNEDAEPLTATLTLYLDDHTLAVQEVEVPAGEDRELLFAHPTLETGVLRAELDHEDALDVDNRAWLALRPATTVKVLLVSEGESTSGYFLTRVLSLDPRIELSKVTPGNYTEQGAYDIVIFDNYAPPALPPVGTLLFFNAVPPMEGVSVEGEMANPPIIATDPDHPMMRMLNPGNVTVTKAKKLGLPADARTLISTQGGALVSDVSRGGRQIVVVAFDLADSNWPLRLSFPLFIQNLIAWAPVSSLAKEGSVSTGSALPVMPASGVETATVTPPSGRAETIKLDPMRPVYFGNTARAGVYTVTKGETKERYAANLLDRLESSVAPAASLSIGRSEVAAQKGRVRQNRELWPWLVAAALGVLMVEWWIYSRRAWL